MTIDVTNARLSAHRNNLMRYRRILATPLTDVERAYVRRRIEEERASLAQLEQRPHPAAGSAAAARRTPAARDMGCSVAAG